MFTGRENVFTDAKKTPVFLFEKNNYNYQKLSVSVSAIVLFLILTNDFTDEENEAQSV